MEAATLTGAVLSGGDGSRQVGQDRRPGPSLALVRTAQSGVARSRLARLYRRAVHAAQRSTCSLTSCAPATSPVCS